MAHERTELKTLRRFGLLLGAITVSTTAVAACSGTTAPGASAGPTVQAAATNAVPTVQALATQAAPTVQAVATQVAPTVQAAATNAAPTVQAVATQAAPVTATVSAAAPVRVTDARLTSNDANVVLQNTGNQPVNLSGWSLLVGTARVQLPAGVDMQPAKTVTVHTTAGTNTDSDVYLGQEAQTLASQLHPGVTIALTNPAGGTISSFVVPNG